MANNGGGGVVTAQGSRRPVAPYLAVGLSTIATGIAARRHIRRNLETIEEAIHAAI